MADERREVRAKIRTYMKDGEEKKVYANVGTAWVSEHGSKISIQLDTVPVATEWDGKLFINKPYEPKEQRSKDNEPQDIDDKPIDLSEIPF